MNTFAIWVSLLTGLTTALGGILILLFPKISEKALSVVLGFAAGVMLALAVLGMLPEAMEMNGFGGTAIGFLFGGVLMFFMDIAFGHSNDCPSPHDHAHHCESYLKTGLMIACGICLHNLPEGMVLGASFEAEQSLGVMLAIAIALHNIPAGIGIAMPLKLAGMSAIKIVLLTAGVGLSTLLGTFVGLLFAGISQTFVAWMVGIAAGAILYTVVDELLPEAREKSNHWANVGIFFGVLLFLLLETL